MSSMGWVCPRCQRVHAPTVQGCNCSGPLDLIGKPLPQPTINPALTGWPLPPPVTSTCIVTVRARDDAVSVFGPS